MSSFVEDETKKQDVANLDDIIKQTPILERKLTVQFIHFILELLILDSCLLMKALWKTTFSNKQKC